MHLCAIHEITTLATGRILAELHWTLRNQWKADACEAQCSYPPAASLLCGVPQQ